jgi:hypothetical protein
VYITEEESFGPEDFARTDALVWLQEDVPLGDYAVPERSIHLQYPPTPVRAPPPSTPPPPAAPRCAAPCVHALLRATPPAPAQTRVLWRLLPAASSSAAAEPPGDRAEAGRGERRG